MNKWTNLNLENDVQESYVRRIGAIPPQVGGVAVQWMGEGGEQGVVRGRRGEEGLGDYLQHPGGGDVRRDVGVVVGGERSEGAVL